MTAAPVEAADSSPDDVVIGALRPGELPALAAVLADGLAFAPRVMEKLLAGRIASGSAPLLLVARRPGGSRSEVLGGALLDTVRPVAGGRLFTRVGVAPIWQGRGVGRALAAALCAELPPVRPPLSVEIDPADARSSAIGAHWGLRPYQRSLRLEYDLTTPAPGAGHDLRPGHDGHPAVRVSRLNDGGEPSEASWRQAFEVYATVSLDLPDRAGAPQPDYTMFRAQLPLAVGVHLAWVDGRPVGVSAAAPAQDDQWCIFLTGSVRAARRSGVARALKAAVHQTARQQGARSISTSTLESNLAMLSLNRSLGYRVVGGISRLEI
ncbi:MAG: GNAT family N-acetyltransferase [Actinomycetota bacterium]|nr:GNAT family N-acetyltransferase [Actinomycetota bacterium]